MKAFREIFTLQFVSLLRSKALGLLLAASAAWMFLMPRIVAGDGTADGAHQVYVRYSLGGVFALLAVCLGAAAAGSISSDRALKRLQLTLVRPVRHSVVALGRIAALTAAGALVMSLAAAIALFRSDPSRPCYSVLSPVMESPRQEAERMYEQYMADPQTPEHVRRAKKSAVVKLLTQKAVDHYQTVPTNETARWTFPAVPIGSSESLAVRLRFTTLFNTREDVVGVFSFGEMGASVSNITQAVVTIPLAGGSVPEGSAALEFANRGANPLMLRPRRDITLLCRSKGDTFSYGLFLAVVVDVCVLAAIISLSMFLGAGLGKSVAVFAVMAVLFMTSVSSTIVEQYPYELETNRKDQIGLVLTRFMEQATSPVGSFNPVDALAEDRRMPAGEVLRAVAMDLLALPLLLSLLSGLVVSRKAMD